MMKQEKTHFISIMSGKGGTGKTLFTAVLGRALAREGYRVLLVDLDIFVRGLSILLSKYTKRTLKPKEVTVSDFLFMGRKKQDIDWHDIGDKKFSGFATSRFFECDILPAVRDIGDPLEYSEIAFTSKKFNSGFTKNLFSLIRGKYDYVLLDCRAGIDSMLVSIAYESDLIISVSEDDDVCVQTNNNLINHLRYKKRIKHIFTLINKGRRITSYRDLQDKKSQAHDFNYIGVIPFDIEVLEDFGKERFWHTVYETLYFRALIDSWNIFAMRNNLDAISEQKYKFPPSVFMSKKAGRIPLIQRMLRLYGILFTVVGISLFMYRFISRQASYSTFDIMIIISLIAGILSFLFSAFDLRKFILSDKDSLK